MLLDRAYDYTEFPIDKTYLVDESVLFLFVGTDTTTYALSNCIYYLLREPRVIGKLKEELRGAEEDVKSGNWVSVNRLNYLVVFTLCFKIVLIG